MAAGAGATLVQVDAAFKRRPGLPAWLVLAPLLIWLIVFVVVPTIMLVVLSLGEQKGLGQSILPSR
jgi:ABC-type sugar transport system permease subunit